jgi:phosphoribosylamine--glycine ligase
MAAAGVPTARSIVVDEVVKGLGALNEFDLPVVIKADGLAAGKGVVITPSRHEAQTVLTAFLEDRALGGAGQRVVIEECLRGLEVSVFALVDGDTVVALPAACDYKRVSDGDRGPNTGGMGAYCPLPAMTGGLLAEIKSTILEPTVREMSQRGMPMRGVLYAGLMLTDDGPQVLEFNARLGDPETQVVLPLVEGDLTDLFDAIAHGRLADVEPPRSAAGAAVAVVAASGGYPGPYKTGVPIRGLDAVPEDVLVFHAGTARNDAGKVVTTGGRVLSLVGLGKDLEEARTRAYSAAESVSFDQMYIRRDIALRELAKV